MRITRGNWSDGAVRVTVVGSVNLDLVATVARLPEAGETIGDARLTKVPGGKGASSRWSLAGVDLAGVRRTDEPTGIALITVDAAGDTTIVVVPGAKASLALADCELDGSDAVICQLETRSRRCCTPRRPRPGSSASTPPRPVPYPSSPGEGGSGRRQPA